VVVSFVIDRDGSVTDAKVIASVDPYLDKEALRLINAMKKWTPGKHRGKVVKVRYTVPLSFTQP
jgi:protein TonB